MKTPENENPHQHELRLAQLEIKLLREQLLKATEAKQKEREQAEKFAEQDKHLLFTIQNILFKELAISLNTTYETIFEDVNRLVE